MRTDIFGRSVKCKDDLKLYTERIHRLEDAAKRFEVIYCCEFVGFLDDEKHRVGCMLHPAQNDGEDWRDISFYGRELCAGHFCPSYHYLSADEKLCLLDICDDWYLYGLCVTDIDLVKEYFRHISERIFESPNPELIKMPPLKEAALEFFSWKEHWQFRLDDVRRFGKYYFDGSQYLISKIDYENIGAVVSKFDKILVSLTSHFCSSIDLEKAESIIADNIQRFASAYSRM